MKKLFSILIVSLFTIVLSIPVFLGVSNALMNMDEMMNMGQENCIEHCLSTDIYFQDTAFTSVFLGVSEIVQKISFFHILSFGSEEYFYILALFFGLHLLAPPSFLYKCKDKDFASLIGIIKSST